MQDYRIESVKLDRLINALTKAEQRMNNSPFRFTIASDKDFAELYEAFRDVRVTVAAQRSTENRP